MSTLPYSQPGFPSRVGIAIALVAAADFLLYVQPAALSLLIFAALVGVAILAIHPTALGERMLLPKLGLLVAGLAPLAENVSPLSAAIAFVCLSAFALAIAGRLGLGRFSAGFSDAALPRAARLVLIFLVVSPFRLIRDFFRWRRTARRLGKRSLRFAAVAVWIMPLALAAVFLVLFGEANPVIEYWLSLIDLLRLLKLIQLDRLIFWLIVLVDGVGVPAAAPAVFLPPPAARVGPPACRPGQPRPAQTAQRRAWRTCCSARPRSCARSSSST